MLLSKKMVSQLILYSPSHIDRLNDPKSPYYDPRFPKRVRLGTGRVAWSKEEIEEYVLAKLLERHDRPSK